MAKRILKWTGLFLGILALAFAALLGWLTVGEYRPDAIQPADFQIPGGGSRPIAVGDSLTVVSQNTGYAGLGRDADFFMDGGSDVTPTGEQEAVNRQGIAQRLTECGADVYFLQEVDTDSSRTGGVDQSAYYRQAVCGSEYSSAYALNYACDFVPYPFPPIGKVHSGLQTLSAFAVESAQRVALPCPFSWPVSTANLKRCLLVSYVPLEGTDRQLVLANLHLEAYDDGEGKAAQTKMLMDFLTAEYEKGNYVIAGGDFNQTFPGALDVFPIIDASLWTPGVLEGDVLPQGWGFAFDSDTPSCRLLNRPYDPDSADTQFYVIDGFILSPNVRLDRVETLDEGFGFSDHNPVSLSVTLEEDKNMS